jgi:hypothetical protein
MTCVRGSVRIHVLEHHSCRDMPIFTQQVAKPPSLASHEFGAHWSLCSLVLVVTSNRYLSPVSSL